MYWHFPVFLGERWIVEQNELLQKMKIAAAYAIAGCITTPSRDYIIPDTLDFSVSEAVAKAVMDAYEE